MGVPQNGWFMMESHENPVNMDDMKICLKYHQLDIFAQYLLFNYKVLDSAMVLISGSFQFSSDLWTLNWKKKPTPLKKMTS